MAMLPHRYIILTNDWRRFDRIYAVEDTLTGRWLLQTNNYGRAMQLRDDLDEEYLSELATNS